MLVKIAPDLSDSDIDAVARVLGDMQVDGVIATNTTVSRLSVQDHPLARETGGRVIVAGVPHEWESAVAPIGASDSISVVGPGTVVSPALLSSARSVPAEAGRATDVAAGPAWPESGVLRIAAGDAQDREWIAHELGARRARGRALPSGVDVSNGHARLALRIVERRAGQRGV